MPVFIAPDKLFSCRSCNKDKRTDEFRVYKKATGLFHGTQCIQCNYIAHNLKYKKSVSSLPNERWVIVHDKYKISNLGRIISFNKYNNERLHNPYVGSNGYTSCYIAGFKRKTIHRLVAEAFLPNPLNLPCVNHKNGIKTDNTVENLEWCTYEHNNRHARESGLWHPSKGEIVGTAKVSEKDVLDIFNSKLTRITLAKKYNISVDCIDDIKSGVNWGWLTGKVYNPKRRVLIEYAGKIMGVCKWAEYFKVSHSTLIERLNNGQSFEGVYKFYENRINERI